MNDSCLCAPSNFNLKIDLNLQFYKGKHDLNTSNFHAFMYPLSPLINAFSWVHFQMKAWNTFYIAAVALCYHYCDYILSGKII